jgi:tetratricopeptide (TPR) repeat protein
MKLRPKGYPYHTFIETSRSWGDDPGLADCLSGKRPGGFQKWVRLVLSLRKSEVHDLLGHYDRGLALAQEALEASRAAELVSGQATILWTLAELWGGQGEFAKMKASADAALTLYRKSGNRVGQAKALSTLGSACEGMDDFSGAEAAFREALSLAEGLGGKEVLANSLYNMGLIFSRHLQDHDRALENIHRALTLFEEMGDLRNQATCLSTIGALHFRREDFAQALEYQRLAASAYETIGDVYGQSVAFENLGTLEGLHGNYPKAFACYSRAQSLSEAMGNSSGIAYLLTDIGNAYQAQGEFDQAAFHHERALRIRRETGERSKQILSLTYLFHAEQEKGNRARAREIMAEAQALSRESEQSHDVLFWLAECAATIALKDGDFEEADREIETGFLLAESLGLRRRQALLLLLRAGLKEMQGDWPAAEDDYSEAVRLIGSLGEKAELARASYYFGRALLAHGDADKGKWYLGEARKLWEAIGARGWLERMASRERSQENGS